jgi:hypothetical protein
MAVRPISSFDGARTADELLSLNMQQLAEIVLQHLKSCEGCSPVCQHGKMHRRYFIQMVEGTSQGLGVSNAKPEYGAKQPAVSEALDEAWNWLVNQGMLRKDPEQSDEWYRITRDGEVCLKRLAT